MKRFLSVIFIAILLWNGYPQRLYDAQGYWSGQVRKLSKQLQEQQAELSELKNEEGELSGPGFHGSTLGLRYPPAAVDALKLQNLQHQERVNTRLKAKTHELMEAQMQLSKASS